MRKNIFKILVPLIVFSISSTSFSADGGKAQSTLGTTGVINVASADVVDGFSVGAFINTDFNGLGVLPRFAVGWKVFELFGGVNYGSADNFGVLDGNVGVKWKFYNNASKNLRMAVLFNMQLNSTPENNGVNSDSYFDSQVLFVASWNIKQFETHVNLGASFGENIYNNFQLDVGAGVQWWLLDEAKTNGVFNLALAADFANFDFKVDPLLMYTGSALSRGKFSVAARFGFLHRSLLVDIGSMDVFDSNPSFYTYIGYNANF